MWLLTFLFLEQRVLNASDDKNLLTHPRPVPRDSDSVSLKRAWGIDIFSIQPQVSLIMREVWEILLKGQCCSLTQDGRLPYGRKVKHVEGQKKFFSLQNVVFGLQKERSSPPILFMFIYIYICM